MASLISQEAHFRFSFNYKTLISQCVLLGWEVGELGLNLFSLPAVRSDLPRKRQAASAHTTMNSRLQLRFAALPTQKKPILFIEN